MRYAVLSARGALKVSGTDAANFLQGLVSNDVLKLQEGQAVYAALLTPQGKFLHDFFIVRREDGFILDCEKARLDDLYKRLSMYRLRSQVTLEKLPLAVAWSQEPGAGNREPGISIFADPRLPQLGYRIIGEEDKIKSSAEKQGWEPVSEGEYDRMRLALGVPDGSRDMIVDKTFLLEAGFEELHGIDFNKGCYVGQEVTARSKFRGQVRKKLYQVRGEKELPDPGTKVMLDGAEVGELRSHSENIGMAMVRIEAVEKARAGQLPFTAQEQVIQVFAPAWSAG